MTEETITRTQAKKELDKDVRKVLTTETHHKHEIIRGSDGRLRWKEKPGVNKLIDNHLDLNRMWMLFHEMGLTKNSEFIRKLYRDMGYSLFGYWEVFYWEVNNELAPEYVPNKEL